ncbi:MAG TPA: VWA domain-containing protein [Pirellulales bacterium]|nr:VWA domain-containing protein [Pirellulales bacterium]
MLPYRLDFDSPWYLLLLALLPVMWWSGRRSLSGLGRVRKWVVLVLRSVVFTLLVASLAEIQWVRTNDRLTVIYLLDQSLSILPERREAMIEFVNESVRQHRKNDDRVGVIVFGREAVIEVPPFDESVQLSPRVETPLDPESTNLAGALKLAQATFPEDAAKRIVIVSDGNQNMGDALDQARHVTDAGVGIDVQPVLSQSRSEILVEKVTLPPDVRKGQPFDLRVVVNNTTQPAEGESGIIKGKLVVSQRSDDQPRVISEQNVELPPGKQVFVVRQQLDQPHFYTYEARFVPDNPADDAMIENNRATTFTHVRGSGQVLLIEDAANRGEHEYLVDRLRRENLEVTLHSSDQLFNGLAELQQFDTVVLANVPREDFTDQQILMLSQNTQSMGCGLVMLGGPNSFGAGGWNNTPIEEAMPVDFQIKSAKVVPKGALALVMHASEMPDGNHWQKVIAKEAIKALGNEDYCGLLPGTDQWLWNDQGRGMVRVGGARPKMLALIDRMTPMDMPDFDSGLKKAHRAFMALTDAAVKHMIIISDGDPTPPSPSVLTNLKKMRVTVSSVAVGAHGPAESAVMKDIALKTGGKYYEVLNPNALPRIFQREARRVARPLVYEKDVGFSPYRRFPHEMVSGIDGPLPPITGFVQTTVKKNPLVEVSLVSPEPPGEDNATILASWTYGLGKAVAFTSDAGARWTKEWTKWDGYDKLFSQMVRWSMRPAGDQGKFTIATDIEQGQVKVFVTALDKDDEFLNFLDLGGAVIGPDMKPHDVQLEQTAPGRYVGSFQADDAGSYFVMLSPGAGQSPLLTGVNVPYSPEFRDRETNEALLASLAKLEPKGGPPGVVIEDTTGRADPKELAKADTFRHDLPKATSRQDVWHFALLIAALTFFGDVFFRRVQVSFAWVPPLAGRMRDRLLGREPQAPPPEYMSRLRSRKAEVSEELEQRRAATRFEPTPDQPADVAALEEQIAAPTAQAPAASARGGLSPEAQADEESYTSRLLKVKKDVRKRTDQQ